MATVVRKCCPEMPYYLSDGTPMYGNQQCADPSVLGLCECFCDCDSAEWAATVLAFYASYPALDGWTIENLPITPYPMGDCPYSIAYDSALYDENVTLEVKHTSTAWAGYFSYGICQGDAAGGRGLNAGVMEAGGAQAIYDPGPSCYRYVTTGNDAEFGGGCYQNCQGGVSGYGYQFFIATQYVPTGYSSYNGTPWLSTYCSTVVGDYTGSWYITRRSCGVCELVAWRVV